jgi:hypothetical protein
MAAGFLMVSGRHFCFDLLILPSLCASLSLFCLTHAKARRREVELFQGPLRGMAVQNPKIGASRWDPDSPLRLRLESYEIKTSNLW